MVAAPAVVGSVVVGLQRPTEIGSGEAGDPVRDAERCGGVLEGLHRIGDLAEQRPVLLTRLSCRSNPPIDTKKTCRLAMALGPLGPDEVTRWESSGRPMREGRNSGDIPQTFGLPELQSRCTLAVGNLLARIRTLYRRDDTRMVRYDCGSTCNWPLLTA